MLKNNSQEILVIFRRVAVIMPFNKLRVFILRLLGSKIGIKCSIGYNARINKKIILGDSVIIGPSTTINCAIIGNNSIIEFGSILLSKNNPIIIGKNTYIGIYNVLEGYGGLYIGDNVHISGPSVGIWTHSSINQCLLADNLDDETHRILAPVKIENCVWIGGKVTIYPGICIGHHSVILPNSVVNSNIPPFSLAGGVPCKIIRKINLDEGFSINFNKNLS